MTEDTRGKLAGTPYDKIKEWNKFSDSTFKELWQSAERAIIFSEKILPHPYMAPYKAKLTTPMKVSVSSEANNLVSFWMGEDGVLTAEIGESYLNAKSDNSNVGEVIKALFAVYSEHYRKLLHLPETPSVISKTDSKPSLE
ncbi:MAG: hypothetical protein EOP48_06020 [Sphingobacteriales bacterium]|nr:MAG: hypothetical protein EOP48_06020 [Sphingobacteriales bacterium]